MDKFKTLGKTEKIAVIVACAVVLLLIIAIATGNKTDETAVEDDTAVTTAAEVEETTEAAAEETTTAAEAVITVEEQDGQWVYKVNGVVDNTFTGVASNENGTWYIKDGVVDFSYNGTFGEYTIENGKVV